MTSKSPLVQCADCGHAVSRKAAACPNCGRPFGNSAGVPITVLDVSMPFVSMVCLLVQVALASIPALVIVVLFVAFMLGALR